MNNIIFSTNSGFLASTMVDNIGGDFKVSVIRSDDLYLSIDKGLLKDISLVVLAGNLTVGDKTIEKLQEAGVNSLIDATIVVDKQRLAGLDILCDKAKGNQYKKFALAETRLIYKLGTLLEETEIEDVFVSFMLSASHYGDLGVEDLTNQTVAIFNQDEVMARLFKERLAFNIIPLVNKPNSAGYLAGITAEIDELIKKKRLTKFTFNMQVVLVPTLSSTGAVFNIRTRKKMSLRLLKEYFNKSDEFKLYDNENLVPVNSDVNDGKIHIASLSLINDNNLSFYAVADNIWTLSVKDMIECIENMF